MVIFPLAPDQTIAQMWSSGARGGHVPRLLSIESVLYWAGYLTPVKSAFPARFSTICTGHKYVWQSMPHDVIVVVVTLLKCIDR